MKLEDTETVGKDNVYSTTKHFDWSLFHVIINISHLKLNDYHSKVRDILCDKKIVTWEDFEELELEELKRYNSKDKYGNKIEFNNHEIKRFSRLFKFKKYLLYHKDFDYFDPCTWTCRMYNNWLREFQISSDGTHGTYIGPRKKLNPVHHSHQKTMKINLSPFSTTVKIYTSIWS